MSEEAAPAKTGETKGAMYHCDYCRKDITNIVRIKCAECADFDLCLECFAAGVQVSPHRNDHPYRVMDHVTTPIFEWDWGTDEELLLLEAIEMFGLGNWSDVADHVGSKDKIKCEEHYHNVYLNGPTGPLPDISQPLPTKESAAETEEEKKSGLKRSKSKNALVPTTTPATPSTPGQTQVKKHQIARPKPKSGLGHLVGWIPARGDFETEYDNDAELILADMEFKEEDTRWERELKLKVLDIYNSKLDARAERKKFILERGLLERKEKKRTKEEREVYNNMRVFARFHSQEEHEQFVQGLINEQRLRKRIEQLQQWRLNGIKTLADGEAFEAEKKKREASAQSRKAKESFMYDSRTSSSLLPPSGRKRGAADELGDPSKRGKTDLISPSAASITSLPEYTPPIRPAFDISTLEGYDLLSLEERRICTELQLIPQHYFVIKERLIRESLARGFIKDTTARQLIRIDVNKTAALFDFFVSTGWVNTQAELAPPPGYGVKKEGQQPQGKRPALTNLTATIPNTSVPTSTPASTTSTAPPTTTPAATTTGT